MKRLGKFLDYTRSPPLYRVSPNGSQITMEKKRYWYCNFFCLYNLCSFTATDYTSDGTYFIILRFLNVLSYKFRTFIVVIIFFFFLVLYFHIFFFLPGLLYYVELLWFMKISKIPNAAAQKFGWSPFMQYADRSYVRSCRTNGAINAWAIRAFYKWHNKVDPPIANRQLN